MTSPPISVTPDAQPPTAPDPTARGAADDIAAGTRQSTPRIVVVAAARLLAFGAVRLLEEGGIPALGTLRTPHGLVDACQRLQLDAVVAVTVDGSDCIAADLEAHGFDRLRRVVLAPPTSLALRGSAGQSEILLLPLTLTAEELRRALTAPRPALRRVEVMVGAAAPLTVRQQQVLALIAEGRSNTAIAQRLGVGTETVKTHLRVIYRKLGVRSRAEAVSRYMEVAAG